MLCKTCNISDICRIREFLNSNNHIVEAPVNRCIRHSSIGMEAPATTIPEFLVPTPESLGLGGRQLRDFSKESLAASGDDPKKDFKLITSDNGEEFTPLIECPTCKGKTPVDELGECSKCSVTICGVCATADGDSGKKYCPKCWSELS